MTINCPACEGEIEVGDDMLGEGLACPHCDHPFQLTADGEVAEYEESYAGDGEVGSAAGGRKKGLIIGASVAGVAVVVGVILLLTSGGDGAGDKSSASAKKSAAPKPAATMAENASADSDLVPPGGMPAGDGEPAEGLPPVEIPGTPDGTIVAVSQALAEGNPRGIWDALPASYQSDVNGLIHEYAKKTDPVMWDKGFGLAGRIVGVLRDKKDFIFNSPFMGMNPQKDEAAKNWDAIVGVLNTVLESDLGKRERLLSLDLGGFLGSTGADLLADFESLANLAPSNQWSAGIAKLRGLTAKVLSTTDGVAEVEVSTPGETNKVEKFVQVEDRWIPQEMALDWENKLAEAKAKLAGTPQQQQQVSMQSMMVMGMVEGVLAQFENAASQEDFNKAAQGVFGMITGLAGGAAPGASGKSPPPMKE